MNEKEWISLIAGDAQRAANEYGYLPSVLIAQTCQETGYGSTDLSQVGRYNVVGMKKELLNDTWRSEHWHGKTYTKVTPEWYGGKKTYITDVFRVYDSYFDGLADYCQFMRDARYDVGGAYKYRDLLGTRDPHTLIEGVRSRGYCTDPEYSISVMRIIEKHNLTQYDRKEEVKKVVEKPNIIDRIAENEWQVPYHNANDAEYLAIHYLGCNGENPDLYQSGSTKGFGGHFYVSKTGQCYQAAKVSDEIWHVGKGGYQYIHPDARNYNTIGIECATYTKSGRNDDDETWYFTEATQEACAKLAAWILYHYNIPFDHLLRHGDITTKNCPSPYKRDQGKGSNWTWEQFKAKVASYLSGTEEEKFTGTRLNVAMGQRHLNNFLPASCPVRPIEVDGIFGPATKKAGYAALQHAMNLDYDLNLALDGIPGPMTKGNLKGHYIQKGETQRLVTYAEIACLLKGRNTAVENPGTYGDGLAKALGGVTHLDDEALLKLLD